MTKISWSGNGARGYESGIDRGVLYISDQPGVPWDGLTSIAENPSGGTARPYYVDGEKYTNTASKEEFGATLTAFTYPDEFALCDGTAMVRPGVLITQQKRKPFGLSYRTMIGNDQTSESGYKVHLVYNIMAAPSAHTAKTRSDSGNPDDFSWNLTTLPPAYSGYDRSAHVYLDSRYMDLALLSAVENILYGTDSSTPRLPSFDEIVDLVDTDNTLTVTDHGDGTYSLAAPYSALTQPDADTYLLNWTTVTFLDADNFTVSSP